MEMDGTTVATSVLSGLIGGIGSIMIYHIKFAQNIIERLTRLETKVSNICITIDELKKDIESLNGEVRKHGEELARLS